MVPIFFIAEALGIPPGNILWNPDIRHAVISSVDGSTIVRIPIGGTPLINGRPVEIDVPAQIVNNRTMVPLRFAVEALGGNAEWDGTNRRAIITS